MMSLHDYELDVLEQKTLSELQEVAKSLNVQGIAKKKKGDLARMIREEAMKQSGILMRDGIVEVLPDGYAFMRIDGYLPNPEDVYVSQSQIKRFGLRTGDSVMGQVRAPKNSERGQDHADQAAVHDGRKVALREGSVPPRHVGNQESGRLRRVPA